MKHLKRLTLKANPDGNLNKQVIITLMCIDKAPGMISTYVVYQTRANIQPYFGLLVHFKTVQKKGHTLTFR